MREIVNTYCYYFFNFSQAQIVAILVIKFCNTRSVDGIHVVFMGIHVLLMGFTWR